MSWSLKISNGDLSINAGQLDTVTRDAKLVQDFRSFLLTELRSDPLYTWYGSSIDGSPGVPSPIATTDFSYAKVLIESEIRKTASIYQRLQLERAKSDRLRYNKSTLTAGEILAAVTNVQFSQQEDALNVTIFISTATDITLPIEISLPPVYSR